MRFYASHGCYDTEQKVGTRFLVDLTALYNGEKAAHSDSIDDAVSYLTIYECVRGEMMIPSHLLENVALRILETLGSKFPQIESAEISITKIAPPLGGDIQGVSVSIGKTYR